MELQLRDEIPREADDAVVLDEVGVRPCLIEGEDVGVDPLEIPAGIDGVVRDMRPVRLHA